MIGRLALGIALLPLLSPQEAGAGRLDQLYILKAGYPRAFFFRITEGQARSGRVPYQIWEQTFLRLNGIMGKCLDEEVPGTSVHNIDFFTRFKQAHPEQVVLLHFNGNSCDPREKDPRFFDGHWVYHNGCRLTEDLPAEEAESVVHVEDPTLFKVNMGRYGDKSEDLGICLLGPDGKPDWNHAEQVELIAIDAAAKTLTVRRGAFAAEPMAFPAGRSYIAAHCTEGPWGRRSNLLWFYNYSTTCPRNAEGRTCADVLVQQLSELFGPEGPLQAFDGIEFDVLAHDRSPGGGIMPARAMDCDADGKPDGGISDGVNQYGIGVYRFCEALREAWGDDRIILADGHTDRSQRAFGILNGIESEGWPILSDWELVDWSGGMNRHNFWRDNARKPNLTYVNHKYVAPGDQRPDVPLSISRLVLASCQLTDSAVTYSYPPRKEDDEAFGVYDELRCGTDWQTNWSGQPKGPAVQLGLQTPEILAERKVPALRAMASFMVRNVGQVTPESGGGSKIVGKPGVPEMSFGLRGLEIPPGDLLVHARVRCEPRAAHPPEMPRLMWLGCHVSGELIRPGEPPVSGMAFRGQEEQEVDLDTGAQVVFRENGTIAGESHRSIFVHPPYRGGSGYTYWEAETAIPRAPARLVFYTGLGDTARSPSDGVTFQVDLRRNGESAQLFSYHHTRLHWESHTVDLSQWPGQEVTLRFTSDCGPNDNTVADHSYWGAVAVLPGRVGDPVPEDPPYTPLRIMTWVNHKWFDASFYFRDRGPAMVDLEFEIEGPEPLYLADLALHNAPDVIYREFESGLVLANPSMHDYVFDIAGLLPGSRFRRLTGSSQQDSQTNDGSAIGDTVTIPPRDALFLVRQ